MTDGVLALVLFMAVAALVTIARRLGIAYPIFLVIGGLMLGFVPGVPTFRIDPDLIFLIVLPPLLYIAGFYTPVRSFRQHLGTIASLAVGLVLATALGVAAAVRVLFPGIGWAVAIALGAILAPPDAIAATAVAARVNLPRRIVTILEGESLLNDAAALTIYTIAIAAAVRGFSPSGAVLTFALAMIGGGAVGFAVGWAISQIRTRIDDTPVEITLSLLTPYVAYLPAEHLGASGVIAVVVAGLYSGRQGSRMMGPAARLTGRAVWETVTFLLNGFVFIATGLQVPLLLRVLSPVDALGLILIGVAVTGVLVAVRALWIAATVYAPEVLFRRVARRPVADAVVLSWAGMRGVVSLAVALALPEALPNGGALPARDALLVVTMTVIVLTLVGQGLTLPWLIRRLRLDADVEPREEESTAREQMLEAAARRIDELYAVWPGHHPLLNQLRETYAHRSEHVERQREAAGAEDQELIEHREIRQTVIGAEREVLLRLRTEGSVDDDVVRKLERELDLEEERMDA